MNPFLATFDSAERYWYSPKSRTQGARLYRGLIIAEMIDWRPEFAIGAATFALVPMQGTPPHRTLSRYVCVHPGARDAVPARGTIADVARAAPVSSLIGLMLTAMPFHLGSHLYGLVTTIQSCRPRMTAVGFCGFFTILQPKYP